MLPLDLYQGIEPAWCPGCGNFGMLKAFKQALAELEIRPEDLLVVSGIGQSGKFPHYLQLQHLQRHPRPHPAAGHRGAPGQPRAEGGGHSRRRRLLRRGGQPPPGRLAAQPRSHPGGAQQPDLRPHQGPGLPHHRPGHQDPAAAGGGGLPAAARPGPGREPGLLLGGPGLRRRWRST